MNAFGVATSRRPSITLKIPFAVRIKLGQDVHSRYTGGNGGRGSPSASVSASAAWPRPCSL